MVLVEFEVLLPDTVEVFADPVRRICVGVEVDSVPVAVVLLPIIDVPTSNKVVEPNVVVRVVDPVLIVETMAEVVNATVEGSVTVVVYERYDPVGVASAVRLVEEPDKRITPSLELESWQLPTTAKTKP